MKLILLCFCLCNCALPNVPRIGDRPSKRTPTTSVTYNEEETGCRQEAAHRAFVSEWQIEAGERIVLPIPNGWLYEIAVDWGDDSEDERGLPYYSSKGALALPAHTYANTGKYTLAIYGLLEAWSFQDIPDSKDSILTVTDLGDMGWRNLKGAFYGSENLQIVKGGNTAEVEDMSYMFAGATRVNPNVESWSFASAKNLMEMFTDVLLPASVYDQLLARIVATTKQRSLTLDVGNSTYTLKGALERQKLEKMGWTISDGGAITLH